MRSLFQFLFFFQSEDGIRDWSVTWSSDVCSSDLEVAQPLRNLAEGEGEVRAGVAVRDGEDVQAVQVVPSRGHPIRRREQRATEARAVHVPDAGAPGHGRPAIPSQR